VVVCDALADHWIVQLEGTASAAIMARLQRISDFFQNVVCAFVLRDFRLLLDQYTKNSRAAFLSPAI